MTGSPQSPTRIPRIYIALFIGLCGGAMAYILLHLAGTVTTDAAQVWSFIVAILELGSSVIATVVAIVLHKKAQQRDKAHVSESPAAVKSERKFRPWYAIIAVLAAFVAFTLPPIIENYIFRHLAVENVTKQITLSGNTAMHDGGTAYATLPHTKHSTLKIAFRILNEHTTGSCVSPARLTVTPVFNGSEGTPVKAIRDKVEHTFNLGEITQKTQLHIRLHNDPYCQVRVYIDSAVYLQ